jgi:hypothetical protein
MTCPFCGVAAEGPHETQQACIEALSAEIRRMRAILAVARPLACPLRPGVSTDEDAKSA